MSLESFTQAIGTHTKTDSRVAYRYGKYYGATNVNEIESNDLIAVEYSFKPSPTKSDHVLPTNYSRIVRKVVSDSPAITRRWITQGSGTSEETTVDMYTEKYISVIHTPFSYVPNNPNAKNAGDQAMVKALNSLSQAGSQLGSDFGEAHQTVNMFSDSVIRGFKVVKCLKAGDVVGAIRALGFTESEIRHGSIGKNIANLWLEFAYGWRPLAQSIFDAQKTLHTLLQGRITISGYGHAVGEYEGTFNYNGQIHHEKSKSSFKTTILAEVSNPLLHDLNAFGLLNPLSIAWELTPYSFVVDWFIPVGQTLQAVTSTVGLTPLGGWTSNQIDDSLTMDMQLTFQGKNSIGYVNGGHYQEIGFAFARKCFTDFPKPRFFASPNPYSTPRALNAIALVRQL